MELVASHAIGWRVVEWQIWSLWPAPNPETGWLPAAGEEANATTAAGSDGTDTAVRPTGTTDEADAGAAASTAAEAGAEAAANTVTGAASGGLPTAADEADAGTRSPDVSLGSGAVVEHDGAVSVSGTPQQAVFQQ